MLLVLVPRQSPDPDENFYGEFCCFMLGGNYAKICKGDYLLCPIAYGRLKIT